MYDLVVGGSHKWQYHHSLDIVCERCKAPNNLCWMRGLPLLCYAVMVQVSSGVLDTPLGKGSVLLCFRDTFGMHGCLGAWVGDRLMPLRTYSRRGNGSPLNGSL